MAEEAARVGLKLNARKRKTLRTECASRREKIVVDGEEVDDVEEFTYLGATVDKEGGGSKGFECSLRKLCSYPTLYNLGICLQLFSKPKLRSELSPYRLQN